MQDKRRVVRVESSTLPRQSVPLKELPYQVVSIKSFWAGFSAGAAYVVFNIGWPGDYYQLAALVFGSLASAFICSAIITIAYIVRATDRNFERDVIVQEFEPEPLANVEAVRITGNGYTTEIRQPQPAAFARWARDVLDDESRTQFSQNEAARRGFSIRNVLGELNRVGALQERPDGNGTYRLSDSGKRLLKEWLS